MLSTLVPILKIIVFASILFVWVVRYQNIVEEFKFFGFPSWLRDLVGILKISCAIMIMSSDAVIVKTGSIGIALLMVMAFFTHIKVSNPFSKMLPSLVLLCLSVLFFVA